MGASFACLVHCMGLPLIVAMLPTLQQALSLPDQVHVWLLWFVVPASGFALVSGQLRHGKIWPLALGLCGLGALAAGALVLLGTAAETPVTVAGSLMLAGAHLANWRFRHARAVNG